MQSSYEIYLKIIKNICCDSTETLSVPAEFSAEIMHLAEEHCTIPFVLSCYRNTAFYHYMMQKTKSMMLNYYQIDQFTHHTVSLLESNHIKCILLKGLSLAAYYPVPEYRKLGDLDLLLADPADLPKAQKILEADGYINENELSDHHLTYNYTFSETGRRFTLELHYRVVGIYQYERANQIINEVFSPAHLSTDIQTINGHDYRVLPPTEYVFYMIHHMLKHYLYSGFGIRLLCDFVLYISRHHKDIHFEIIHKWCRESRISHLYEIIMETCRIYLGLPETVDSDIHYDRRDCETFIIRILEDGDMGDDVSGSLVGSTSYQKVNLLTYFKEGHVQMKVRFPKAGCFPVLWPVLWGITLFCFLRNNRKVRNTTLKQTLHDFKKKNQKTQLIRVFDNSDS